MNEIIQIVFNNGTKAHGPRQFILAWVAFQLGYQPQQILPITILPSPYKTAADADKAAAQWIE